jgi:hypothetical protein
MKYTPLIGADMTGRLGAVIASKNRYGLYFREGAIPVNPSTGRQDIVRNVFATLAVRWSSVLTPAQRSGWETYAAAVPIIGNNGKSQKITGFSMYIRCASACIQCGTATPDTAPAVLSMPETDPTVTVSASTATQLVSVTFNNALPWASEAGGHLTVHVGQPQLATRNFFGGPYRYAGTVNGNVTPPTSPQTFTAPFTIATGQKVWVQFRVVRKDGRISGFFRTSCTVSA